MSTFFDQVYEAVNKSTNTRIIIKHLVENQFKRSELIIHMATIGNYKKNLRLEIYQYLIVAVIKQLYASYEKVLIPRSILSSDAVYKFINELNINIMKKLSKIIYKSVTNINVKYLIYQHNAFLTKMGKTDLINRFVEQYLQLYFNKRLQGEYLFFEKIFKDDSKLVYKYTIEVNEFDCPICLNKSTEYHKYHCNHFICKECSFQLISNYQKDNTKNIQCPYCRQHIEVIVHN